MKIYLSLSCAMVIAITTGCTTINNDKSNLSKSSQDNSKQVAESAEIAIQQITGELKLKDALEAAELVSPILSVAKYKIEAAEAAISQADSFSNPSFKVGGDNFSGQGDKRGTENMSKTIGISQKIEFWGKRDKRVSYAKQKYSIAELEFNEAKIAIEKKVKLAFLSVYYAQEKEALALKAFDIVKKNYDAVLKRIKSGEISSVQANKIKIELASANIALTRSKRNLKTSRKNLVSLWGSKIANFAKVSDFSTEFFDDLKMEDYKSYLKAHPTVLKLQTIIEQEKASLAINEAKKYPDVTISGGLKKDNESDNESYFVGVSIPIPIFNWYSGDVKVSKANIKKADAEKIKTLLDIEKDLEICYDEIISAKQELDIFENDIIPAAEASYQAVAKAFKVGEQSFLNLLDTQHTLIKAKKTKLDMFLEYQKLIIKLNAIVGK